MNTIPLIISLIFVILTRSLDPFLRYGREAKSITRTEKDKNSTTLLGILNIVNLLFLLSGFLLNRYTVIILFSNSIIPFCGNFILIIGFFIRVISIRTLREYYTRTLKIQPSQKVVDTGIYKYIRHPGYFGSILQWLGAGISSNNMIVLSLTVLTTLIVYHYRINREEMMLLESLGNNYRDYMKHTKRLIPGIY